MHLQEETEGSKEVQGLHFPHLALAFPVACYRLVTNFQETNRQQETHARSVNLRLSRNLSQPWVSLGYSFTFRIRRTWKYKEHQETKDVEVKKMASSKKISPIRRP